MGYCQACGDTPPLASPGRRAALTAGLYGVLSQLGAKTSNTDAGPARFRCRLQGRPRTEDHPSRQHPRDERRQLPAQPEPKASNPDGKLKRPPSPRLTPWAHGSLPRAPPRQPVEGTPRRARGPPMDYGDKPAAAKWSLFTPPRWSLFAPPLTNWSNGLLDTANRRKSSYPEG